MQPSPRTRSVGEYRYAIDVEGSTALTQRLGDARARDVEAVLSAMEAVLQAIDEFLSEGEEAAVALAEPAAPGGFRTILFCPAFQARRGAAPMKGR